VARRRNRDEITTEELRRLLVEKQRASRQERLDRFRKTGRVVTLASDYEPKALDNLRSEKNPIKLEGKRSEIHKRIFDGLLLFVELLAVAGLFLLLYNGIEVIRNLNSEVVEVLELPTLTSTPLITAVVLPSGHTPPNISGGAQPNEAEIPEHLRPLVQSLVNVPIPTPGPQQAIQIQIPSISVNAPVVQGDGWEQLKKGVAQHIGTANPGKKGNLVLSAHNDIFGEIFRHLDDISPGDEIIVRTNQQTFTYIAVKSDIVEATAVQFLNPTPESTITLISCYPYLVDNKRIVIRGYLQRGNQ
jgi:sortase A